MTTEQKLDAFVPDANSIAGIKRQLMEAGIDGNAIPMDWLVAIAAGMTKWISQTSDGMSYAVNRLGFKWSSGKDDFQYDYHEYETGYIYKLKPKQVHFFAGAAVNGKPVDPSRIVTSKSETNQCDSCGITSHCTRTVRDPAKDRLITMCNACLYQDDSMRMKEYGSITVCNECTCLECFHHPKSQKSQNRLKA